MMADKAAVKAKNLNDILKVAKDNEADYIKFWFTDLRSTLQNVTFHMDILDEDMLKTGIMFDGSSIAGWKAINESDMHLVPDCAKIAMDPFAAQPTLNVFCTVNDPISGKPYNRDPRSIALAAEAYVAKTGIADQAFFGPEAEFFVFDDVKFDIAMNKVSFEIDSEEGPYNTGKSYDNGNMGHRPRVKGGYFPESPVDSCGDLRAEMLTVYARDWRAGRKAPSRGRGEPARTRDEILDPGRLRRQHAALQARHPQRRACLRQDRDVHAQTGLRR